MAKIALVCPRDRGPQQREALRARMSHFLESLRPDNLPDAQVVVNDEPSGVVIGIFNPAEPGSLHGGSAYAGWLAERNEDWWQPSTPAPDGTYAMFRSDSQQVELLADFCGSRTIWYAQTPELFIASTSQRAIVWFTCAFEPNPDAVLWMLSSGTLGPGLSWDKRVRALAPAASARLDRHTWRLEVSESPIVFQADPIDDEAHAARLRSALIENFARLNFDWSRWTLPLSGGHDSRMLLMWMPDRRGLQTITWGTTHALQVRGSDAQVARQVAEQLKVSHRYFVLENTSLAVERVMKRFLRAGEGRVDHLSGYMDGFDLWSTLARNGVKGIIRGDHPFGHKTIGHANEARYRTGLLLWSDHEHLPSLQTLSLTHLGPQNIPAQLKQKTGESAEDWRDRLYQAFRTPTVFAALNELKTTYVEVSSPLLRRPFAMLARTQPAHLRTGKVLFKRVAGEKNLSLEYATSNSIATPDTILDTREFQELLLDSLSSLNSHAILSVRFADYVAGRLSNERGFRRSLSSSLHKATSRFARLIGAKGKRHLQPKTPSARRIAFRAFLINSMDRQLREDAQKSRLLR